MDFLDHHRFEPRIKQSIEPTVQTSGYETVRIQRRVRIEVPATRTAIGPSPSADRAAARSPVPCLPACPELRVRPWSHRQNVEPTTRLRATQLPHNGGKASSEIPSPRNNEGLLQTTSRRVEPALRAAL